MKAPKTPYNFAGQPLTGSLTERLERVSARLLVLERSLQAVASPEVGVPRREDRAEYFGVLAEDVNVLRHDLEGAHDLAVTESNLIHLASDAGHTLPDSVRSEILAAAKAAQLRI